MLLALLYTADDAIAAAALACDQQPLGDRYWYECSSIDKSLVANGETAYVEILDEELCRQLLQMKNGDGFNESTAAQAVAKYLDYGMSGDVFEKRAA